MPAVITEIFPQLTCTDTQFNARFHASLLIGALAKGMKSISTAHNGGNKKGGWFAINMLIKDSLTIARKSFFEEVKAS